MKTYFRICISVSRDFHIIFGAIFICLSVVFWSSCQKPKSYSPIPEISFKKYTVTDTVDTFNNPVKALTLTFNFADGDGDLSSSATRPLVVVPPDTVPKDTTTYSKIYLKLYEKKKTKFFRTIVRINP